MVPLDILDYILSFLQSDPDTLIACSKVHYTLTHLVERHLYAHITFDRDSFYYCNSWNSKKLDLLEILSENPHIADCIHNLDICISLSSLSLSLEDISSALPLLSQLQRIKLALTGANVHWISLPQRFRCAFINCLRLPSMKEVYIDGETDFPLAVFNDCKAIKKLTLHKLLGCHYHGPETHSAYPQLDVLSIFYCNRCCLSNIIPWTEAHLSRLCSLKLRLSHEDDLSMLPTILKSCSNTLTDLDLELGFSCTCFTIISSQIHNDVDSPVWTKYDNNGRDTSSPISTIPPLFSGLVRLEQFTIHTPITSCAESLTQNGLLSRSGWKQSSLPAINQLLKTAPPLKLLILHFRICLGKTRSLSDFDWSFLILFFTDAYPPFRRVCLRITDQVYPGKYLSPTRILSSLSHHETLKRLVRNGNLVIDSGSSFQEIRRI